MTREERRKMLCEHLNENDFDIDSFIDYKPNFKTMRKIPFDPSLIGKPGIEVKVDGEVPEYIKEFKKDFDPNYSIRVVAYNGIFICLSPNDKCLTMYRQHRSAEEIAKEVLKAHVDKYDVIASWDLMESNDKELFTALVQSGIDEMKGGEE